MKVLFNTYPMAFHRPGGGEIQLLAYERHLFELGVHVERFDQWSPHFSDFDLVHYFSCIGGSWHFCNFAKQLGLPLVVSSSLWITPETTSNYPINEIRDQLSLADRVVTNSLMESEMLSKVLGLPVGRFRSVPNAVDQRYLQPADSELFRDHFGIKDRFVLNVGNIEPRKNQLRLLEATNKLGIDLILIGNVRHEEYWRRLQAEGGRLRYLGCIDPSDPLLASAYAACDVFALPSLLETPGLAALEAMAQGAALVVTEVGSTKEYFSDDVIYVDPTSTGSIADGLQASLGDRRRPTRRPMTWAAAVRQLKDVYAEVLHA